MKRTSLKVVVTLAAVCALFAIVPQDAQAGSNWSVSLGGHHGSAIHFGNRGVHVDLGHGCYAPRPVYRVRHYRPVHYRPSCYTPPCHYPIRWY